MNSEIFRVGQTYSFMGYDWTACELINKGKTLVIQSHGKGLFLINKEKASFPGEQRKTLSHSGLPAAARGSVLSTATTARGMSTRMAASTTTTVSTTTLLSRPLLISIYPK